MRRLAIMKNVRFGCDDPGVGLIFDAYINEHTAARQGVYGQEALRVIEESGVSDVYLLEGKPCWVQCEGNTILFQGLCKI